jgi:hypothetical protein
MCHAPQLISSPTEFVPEKYLPDDAEERLKAWDNNPSLGPAVLTENPPRRLGHYFERLYECLLENLLGWEILLKNQPIRSDGITLGELDFIVRNPLNQAVEHHEIAVKFYLGYQGSGLGPPLWYGPSSKDRLDLKTKRLLTHQSCLSEKPETRALLHSLNIPTPAQARIFMPGYLFYPAGQQIESPEGLPADHLRGEWLYVDDVEAFCDTSTRPEATLESLIPLVKPHWLGPWCQPNKPDSRDTKEALAMVRDAGVPRLFAVLRQSSDDGLWREHSRLFVVSRQWPGR